MKRMHLIDTGPIVAFLNGSDQYHAWTVEQWRRIPPPMMTCEAVIAEACHLMRKVPGGRAAIMTLLSRGILQIRFELSEHLAPITQLMRKYAELPISLADACLIRMTELHSDCELLTIDGDFRIYRRLGRRTIPIRIPAR